MLCRMCGKQEAVTYEWKKKQPAMCSECAADWTRDQNVISEHIKKGHTPHCACRMVWGDGECECTKTADREV